VNCNRDLPVDTEHCTVQFSNQTPSIAFSHTYINPPNTSSLCRFKEIPLTAILREVGWKLAAFTIGR